MLLRQAPWITRFATRSGLLLYHDLTGRTLRLDGPAAMRAFAAFAEGERAVAEASAHAGEEAGGTAPILRELVARGFLVGAGENADRIVEAGYPLHCRWVVFHAPRGRGPLLMERNAHVSHSTWQARTPSPVEWFVWTNARGVASAGQILEAAGESFGPDGRAAAAAALRRWTSGQWQLLKLLDRPLAAYDAPPVHVFSLVFHHPLAGSDESPAPAVDLAAYHRDAITDASDQFDVRETTLSHLLRFPSRALGGRTFGAALAAGLEAHGSSLGPGTRVVEIGGGTGWVARRLIEARPGIRHVVVDLSPALLAGQRKLLEEAGLSAGQLRGDGRALPLRDRSVDVIVSNEVIADLPAVRVDPASPPEVVRRLGVTPSAPRVVNVGALEMLEEVARVLRPGGLAYLSEYGEIEGEPEEARHLDHPEIGIEFSVLARAASALGFAKVELTSVADLCGLENVPVLSVPAEQHAALSALLRALGGPGLEKRAYAPEELGEACAAAGADVDPGAIHHLSFTPARERLMSFDPRRMWALILRR